MRARALAGVAVAAWSKTAMVASAAHASTDPGHADEPPEVSTDPPPVSTCQAGPIFIGPTVVNTDASTTIQAAVYSRAPYKSCPSAVLSLDATSDNVNWKRLDSVHIDQTTTAAQVGSVQTVCLPGNWTYRVLSVADDGSYKSSQRASFAC